MSSKLLGKILASGGFSVNQHNNEPRQGYMVSHSNCEMIVPVGLLNDSLMASIEQTYLPQTNENTFFGAWVDNEKVYFDLSENIPDKEKALNVGIQRQQLGIFDLSNFETVYTGITR